MTESASPVVKTLTSGHAICNSFKNILVYIAINLVLLHTFKFREDIFNKWVFGNLGPVTGLFIECTIIRMRDALRRPSLTLEFVRYTCFIVKEKYGALYFA